MPSGNTNIMKKYRKDFNCIEETFYSPFRVQSDEESVNSFIKNCEGRYGIEQELETQGQALSICEKFVYDLELVLSANKLKDESEYREYIKIVNSYIDEYGNAIAKLKQFLPFA